MTEQDKQLLLKDLCARLYTGTIVNYGDTEGCDYPLNLKTLCNFPEEKLKCYLRPMSSMTEEEKKERKYFITKMVISAQFEYDDYWHPGEYADYVGVGGLDDYIDWLNQHHFDYRNLIEKGLALPAPPDMYKIN